MTEPRMSGTKKCCTCKEELPVLAFGVDRRSKDGLRCYCRECFRTRQKQSEWYKEKRAEGLTRRIKRMHLGFFNYTYGEID